MRRWGYIRTSPGQTVQSLSSRKTAAARKEQGRIKRDNKKEK